MIYPLLITPNFLLKIKDDEKLFNTFINFTEYFKEYWQDIFILIDDKENFFTNEYKKIQKNFAHSNPKIHIITDLLISSIRTKKISINQQFKKMKESEIINFLKSKNIKTIVSFPNYFENNFIKHKDIHHKISLHSITYEQLMEKILSITRFSKNVALIDSMIPYNLTNINSKYEHKNEISKINVNSDEKKNGYALSLKILIKEIYNSNFFKDNLKIHIRTTLDEGKIKHLKQKIIYKIKDNFDESEIKNDIEAWEKLGDTVKKIIEDCTNNVVKDFKPNITVNSLYKDPKEDSLKNNEPAQDIYDRHIVAIDLDASFDIRKGLDMFDPKSPNKLRFIKTYTIRFNAGEYEKSASMHIFSHPKYKPTTINYNLR
jgi:hypothetical protein